MIRNTTLTLMAVFGAWLPASANPLQTTSATDPIRFARDIQPLLARHCFECHGPDQAESGLRLDVATSATARLESGRAAITPGKPGVSELLRRITTDDESERMPPEGAPLSAAEIAKLRTWIESGAKFETHWAYVPVTAPEPPKVRNADRVTNAIDRFVLARLEERGLSLSDEVERATLIRRLYYDLTGLPPTPAEVDTFVADKSPRAVEDLVDRLLTSKHFGERWGRHWLDKARYADSDGYEKDRPRPNAWRYRDWVIQAINADMPFDQFTIEQLAGDLLPDAGAMQKLATAFHRQTLTNTEGGTDQEQFRVEATFDRTETTSTVWMGLTMTCARCHTHKYDQISQREYYQLFAFFDDANEANVEVARSESELARYEADRRRHETELAAVRAKFDAAKQKLQPEIARWLAETTAGLSAATPISFSPLVHKTATASSGSKISVQRDGSFLLTGTAPDKDTITLEFDWPAHALTGLRLEVLPDASLPGRGPGRAPNGNFVLSELRAAVVSTDAKNLQALQFSGGDANFSQAKFSPAGALSTAKNSGWAISPQMGKAHQITFYLKAPIEREPGTRLRVVLDQQYGGRHTIGRFRITAMTGFDPARSLPKLVVDAVRTPTAKRTAKQLSVIADHVATLHPDTSKLAHELVELRKKAPKPPLMSVRVLQPASRDTRILHRGDFLQPEDPVESGAISVVRERHPLTSRHPNKPADRLDLARWLVHRNHPLTARVTVNQIWARLFGRGIVATQNDFGVRGDLPTHPELLDWLAARFAGELRWSRKALIRTIVLSSTYRQDSRHRTDLRDADPTNRLFGRQNRVRVEAEIIRDLCLSAGGLLTSRVGGPSVFPPLPPGVAELSYANNFKWKTSTGEDRYRRGMYTFFKRTSPHPTLISFDCPDSNTTRLQRETSNTPLQALATLNNDVYTEAAQGLARRVLSSDFETDTDKLTLALRICIARQPQPEEVERFVDLLTASRSWYAAHPEDARLMAARHPANGIAADENAAWVATVRMILNLDEFIVRD